MCFLPGDVISKSGKCVILQSCIIHTMVNSISTEYSIIYFLERNRSFNDEMSLGKEVLCNMCLFSQAKKHFYEKKGSSLSDRTVSFAEIQMSVAIHFSSKVCLFAYYIF